MSTDFVGWSDRLTDRALTRFSRSRADADRSLFGELQPWDTGFWRLRYIVPILFVVGLALNLARTPAGGWGVLWAEDGSIFMSGAISNHWALSIITPYNGYIHIVPRIISTLFGVVVPLRSMAVAFTIASLVVMCALGCFVYVLSRSRFRSPYVSLLVWFSFIAMSMAGGEVLASIANLHWFFDGAAVWVLVTRHRSTSIRVIALVVLVLAILSDGLMLMFLPLVLLRYLVIIESGRLRSLLVSLAAFVLQLAAVIAAPLLLLGTRHPHVYKSLSAPDVVHAYIDRVVLAGSIGITSVQGFVAAHWWFWYFAVFGLVVVVVLLAWRSRNRVLALLLLAYSILFFAACWVIGVGGGVANTTLSADSRYSVVPIIIFIGFVGLALDSWLNSRVIGRVPSTVIVAVLGALLILVFVRDFQYWKPREGGTPLAATVDKAAVLCVSEPLTHEVRVAVAPRPTFDIELTCDQVLHGVH